MSAQLEIPDVSAPVPRQRRRRACAGCRDGGDDLSLVRRASGLLRGEGGRDLHGACRMCTVCLRCCSAP
jgi:hypothetical protein